MSLHLPVDLYSPDQLSAVILELHDYIGALRDRAAREKVGASAPEEPLHVSALLLGALHGADVKKGDIRAAEVLLGALKLLRDKAPVVHVTLAGLPNRTMKRQLTVWFRTQIHKHALMTFAMRTDIGGGIVLRAGSHVYDFSLKQVLLSNKNKISEIYDGVRQ